MSYFINPDGSVGGGMQNPLERLKELDKMQGGNKMAEPIVTLEYSQEVIDTIAKKDYSKESLIQNTGMGSPRNMFFEIKKGDPIQVIKTKEKTNVGDGIFYSLKKHNGQNFAMTIEEENKLAIKKAFGYRNYGVFSSYNIPKDVVEDTTIVETTKELLSPNSKKTSSLFKIVLLGVVAFVIYKVVKKQQ
jgi:hypothetical protein